MTRSGEQGDAFFPSQFPERGEDGFAPLTVIARFANAAEAGYFAHELKLSRNIPVSLQAEEDYDAVSGHWSTGFQLLVPQPWAERAALTLQELVRQTEAEDYRPERPADSFSRDLQHASDSQPFNRFSDEDLFADQNQVHWLPIVVTLAAGSMAIWGIKKFWEPPRAQPAAPAEAPPDVLWEVMRTPHGGTWVQFDAKGRRIREIEIDPSGTSATLREDRDGDQVFDRSHRLQRR